jgi:hypothetical protein
MYEQNGFDVVTRGDDASRDQLELGKGKVVGKGSERSARKAFNVSRWSEA